MGSSLALGLLTTAPAFLLAANFKSSPSTDTRFEGALEPGAEDSSLLHPASWSRLVRNDSEGTISCLAGVGWPVIDGGTVVAGGEGGGGSTAFTGFSDVRRTELRIMVGVWS